MAVEVETPAFPSLFNSVTSDLKSSQQNWEAVTKTAGKLSSQLLTTATSLSNFIDQIQSVGDSANNVKGASRDIGASLTRFCMRQRSIENHIRSLANALSAQFCDSMEKKSDEWKKKVSDIERRRGKCFKKSKQKKYFSQADLVAEQREGCLELLFEQRNQFAFFVNAILPILDIEINLLDEGEHVKQVRDSMDQMVNGTDPQQVVFNSIDDFCLNSERRMISPANSVISSIASGGGLDRTISPSIDSFYSTSRNSTISGATYGHYHQQRQYVPVSTIFQSSSPTVTMSRPPLPKQPGYYADSSSTRGSSQTEVNVPLTLSASSADVAQNSRRQRPLSFSGGDMNGYSDKTLKMVTTPGERSSASLIAETLQQIDQLGVELDSYCNNLTTCQQDSSSGVGSSVVSSVDQNGSSNYIDSPIMNNGTTTNLNTPVATPPTYRTIVNHPASVVSYPPSQTSTSSIGSSFRNRPPPPERRNSTIQTASSFAPSIADLRTAKGDYGTVQFREPPRYPGPPPIGYKQQQQHQHPPLPPNFQTHSFK
uniref:IMD domain-containing protein n=1 Tax=Panagrolaimus sp. PS1159 TaxID=55785 RepID=A0AC35EYH4_9BILA